MPGTEKDPVRALFICHYNQRRSATAERIFARDEGVQVLSAGTSEQASVRINQLMLEWADVVFIMDGAQRAALEELFPGHAVLDRIVCLDIPDRYHFLDPELVTLLRERASPYLKRSVSG